MLENRRGDFFDSHCVRRNRWQCSSSRRCRYIRPVGCQLISSVFYTSFLS